MSTRPRHRSTRPGDEPIFTNLTGMDFEKRRITVPPSFIDLAILAGGDEYVKASDLATIVNVLIEEMEKQRIQMVQIKYHLAKMSNLNVTDKDVGG